jgi:hypothetical protein
MRSSMAPETALVQGRHPYIWNALCPFFGYAAAIHGGFPIRAVAVVWLWRVARCPATFDQPMICPNLIARVDDLDALRRVAAGVATGSGQSVLVVGETGISKSRLVREFARGLERDDWVVQQGHCYERDRLLPNAPFLDALRAVRAP